jgi:hypothetical protein
MNMHLKIWPNCGLLLYKILSVPTNNVANLWLHYAMNIEYVKKLSPTFVLHYAISILYVNKI